MKSIPHLEKFKSRKEWEGYIWKKLIKELTAANSIEKIQRTLDILLTARERKQIINRLAAISFLKQGKSYRDISALLWLSSTTISAIRKSLKEQKEYVSRYMRSKKPEKKPRTLTKEGWEQLEFSWWIESLFTLPPPPLPHPRLNHLLGIENNFYRKRK